MNQQLTALNSRLATVASKPQQLELLDNTQFIYELSLAQLELAALCSTARITDDFRIFNTLTNQNNEVLVKRLAYFKRISGKHTDYYHLQKYNQTRSVNQFLTHWIYPYKGKFHPQMIRALLNIINMQAGELLLDPFVGSGTALLEAQLLNINGIGIDISPLCVLISKVKTQSVDFLADIKKYQDHHLHKKDLPENLPIEVKNFYRVAEMIAHSDKSRRNKNFITSYIQNVAKMLASVEDYARAKQKLRLELGTSKVIIGDSRKIALEDESVDGIITSPPYSIALNYITNDAHSLIALGYDLDKIKDYFIGVRGNGLAKFELYDKDMSKAYSEMFRVLKKGRYCVIIIGNVTFRGQEVDTAQKVWAHCANIGFTPIKKMAKIIYGLYNVMQKEYILILQK